MHRSPWVLELSPIDCHVLSWPFKKHRLRPTTWKASKHWCNGNTAYQLICCASLLMLCSYKVYNRIVLDTHWTEKDIWSWTYSVIQSLVENARCWCLAAWHPNGETMVIITWSFILVLGLRHFLRLWCHLPLLGSVFSQLKPWRNGQRSFEIRVCLGPTEWTATDINIHQLLMYSILARATSTQPLRIS